MLYSMTNDHHCNLQFRNYSYEVGAAPADSWGIPDQSSGCITDQEGFILNKLRVWANIIPKPTQISARKAPENFFLGKKAPDKWL
jgi:hypothetical protein